MKSRIVLISAICISIWPGGVKWVVAGDQPTPRRELLFSLQYGKGPGTISMRPANWEGSPELGLRGIEIDREDHVYLADSVARTITVFRLDGSMVRKIDAGRFVRCLISVCLARESGVLYVLGANQGEASAFYRVHIFDVAGRHVGSFGLSDVPNSLGVHWREYAARGVDITEIASPPNGNVLLQIPNDTATLSPYRNLEFLSAGKFRREVPSLIADAKDRFYTFDPTDDPRKVKVKITDAKRAIISELFLASPHPEDVFEVKPNYEVHLSECTVDSRGRLYVSTMQRLPQILRIWGNDAQNLEVFCRRHLYVFSETGRYCGKADFLQSPFIKSPSSLNGKDYAVDDSGHVYQTDTKATGIDIVRWTFALPEVEKPVGKAFGGDTSKSCRQLITALHFVLTGLGLLLLVAVVIKIANILRHCDLALGRRTC